MAYLLARFDFVTVGSLRPRLIGASDDNWNARGDPTPIVLNGRSEVKRRTPISGWAIV